MTPTTHDLLTAQVLVAIVDGRADEANRIIAELDRQTRAEVLREIVKGSQK